MNKMIRVLRKADDFLWGGSMPEDAADLANLRERGIDTIISLDRMPLQIEQKAKGTGFKIYHIEFPDFSAPTKQETGRFMAIVRKEMGLHRPIFVHCYGGRGRTGTMLGVYLIHKGVKPPLMAINMAGCVETGEQKEFLLKYGAEIQKRRENAREAGKKGGNARRKIPKPGRRI